MIVLDSFGIGEAPDAADFGDVGANTIESVKKSGALNIPNMTALGLGNIDGVSVIEKVNAPLAKVARLRELSRGKDTTTGHWEIAGAISEHAMPTYPNGFPREVLDKFEAAVGRETICNLPYSGTDVIRDYGDEHVTGGKLIVYTSQDSVFQIAAHEDVVPPEKLYEYCEIARSMLVGEHAVGRVIARPFNGASGAYKRTANRRDFSLPPHGETVLDRLKAHGFDVISVGKISDIFAGKGITRSYTSHSNREGMQITSELAMSDFHGLCFLNLVEFDSHYGHRQDIDGYANALSEFDLWLGGFLKLLRAGDTLIVTADHGCDPGDDSTDHTREYVPLIMTPRPYENLGTVIGFDFVARTVEEIFGI